MSESVQHRPRLRILECLRGAAACYVFAHHYVHVVVTPHHPRVGWFFKFGQFAVLVFFVVSGFVIYYSTVTRAARESPRSQSPDNPRFRPYFIRRFRRIYPPFLLALAMTYVAQCILDGRVADVRWGELAGNLAMLQDENEASWFSPYQTNSSLWSLSYEWAFYMLFFPLHRWLGHRARLQRGVVAAAAVGAFVIHQIWPSQLTLFVMYFPIWWAGVELAREYLEEGAVTVRRQLIPLATVALVGVLWAYPVWQMWSDGRPLVMWKHPVIEFRHFVTATVILVGGLVWHRLRWRGFYSLLGPFERLAPISYGLYIVHKPIVQIAAQRAPLGNIWLELVWVIPVVLGLSWVSERWIHRYVLRLLPAER